MRLKRSNLLAFRIHFSTELEEGGERREEEPKGQRQQGLRLQCVLGMYERLGPTQTTGAEPRCYRALIRWLRAQPGVFYVALSGSGVWIFYLPIYLFEMGAYTSQSDAELILEQRLILNSWSFSFCFLRVVIAVFATVSSLCGSGD